MQEKKSNRHFTIPSLFHLVKKNKKKTRVHIHVTGAIKALSNKKVDSYFQVLPPVYDRERCVAYLVPVPVSSPSAEMYTNHEVVRHT